MLTGRKTEDLDDWILPFPLVEEASILAKFTVLIAKGHNFALDASMTEQAPTHCLELTGIRKAEAESMAERLDYAISLDTLAVSITEIDEATASWQLIA